MNWDKSPFNSDRILNVNDQTVEILNVIRSLNNPKGGSCSKKQSDESEKQELSIKYNALSLQSLQPSHSQYARQPNTIITSQLLRKRKKILTENQEQNDPEIHYIDSISNKRITDYFGQSMPLNRKKQSIEKQEESVCSFPNNRNTDLQLNPIIKNLRQKIEKKKKSTQELRIQVDSIIDKNAAMANNYEQNKRQQREVLIKFLQQKFSQKIYYQMAQKIERETKQNQINTRYMEILNNKIKLLEQEKKKKSSRDQFQSSNHILEFYGVDRQNYMKEWKKRLENEKIALEKQSKKVIHEWKFEEQYYKLPSILTKKSESNENQADKNYLLLYSRKDSRETGIQTGLEVKAMDLNNLSQLNMLVIAFPKMMKIQRKIQVTSRLQQLFNLGLQLKSAHSYSLFTENLYFYHNDRQDYIQFGHAAWPEKSRRVSLSEIMIHYETFNETIAKYIIKIILRGLEQIKNKLNLSIIILPENVIFNERNQIKLDSWIKNQLFKFIQFSESLLTGQSYLYLSPQFKIMQYGQEIQNCSLWTVGIIFYELLFDRKPFKYPKNSPDYQQFYIMNDVEFPLKPTISQPTKQFIRQCLKRPSQRLQVSAALKHPCFDIKK